METGLYRSSDSLGGGHHSELGVVSMEAPQYWLDMGYTQQDWDRLEQVERAIASFIAKVEESELWAKNH